MQHADMSETAVSGKSETAAPPNANEVRLSFRYFYLVVRWGSERRSPSRIANERQAYPALTASTAPILAGAWVALCLTLFVALHFAFRLMASLIA